MDSLQLIAGIFIAAGLGGITMFAIRVSGRPTPPTWLAVAHGLIAATGLALLARLYFMATLPTLAAWSLLAFVLAALGGLFVFFRYHRPGVPLPIPLLVGHGLIALTGIVLVSRAAFGW